MSHSKTGHFDTESLRKSGHRITKNRKETIAILSGAKSPLSAQEIIEELHDRGFRVNKTTVYRELDFLLQHSIVIEIDLLDGRKRYELIRADDHHHHLICKGCHSIKCVKMPGDLNQIEKEILKTHKFLVQDHVLEFFGLCPSCRKQKGKIK